MEKSRFYAHLYVIKWQDDVADIPAEAAERVECGSGLFFRAVHGRARGSSGGVENDGEVGRPGMPPLRFFV